MEQFFDEYGLLAVAVILFLDDIGIPIPGGSSFIAAAIASAQNPAFPPLGIFLIGFLIPPLANSVLFYLGRHGLRDWLRTHGHKFFLPEKRIKKAEKEFKKYGNHAVFFAAFFTTIRAVSSVIAGGLRMPAKQFFSYHISGVFLWSAGLTLMGYFFGKKIWHWITEFYEVVLIILTVFVLIKVVHWYLSKRKK